MAQVVKEAIMHPWMEQEEQVERSLPPEQRHHPTRIGQLEKRGVLAALKGQKEAQGESNPSVEVRGDRAVKKGGQEGPHPSVELREDRAVKKGAQEGLREDRAVKQEDPVESH